MSPVFKILDTETGYYNNSGAGGGGTGEAGRGGVQFY